MEGAEHLALFTSLILPRALAVFVRYPTRIAHAFGTSRRFSPELSCILQAATEVSLARKTGHRKTRGFFMNIPLTSILGTATTIFTTKADLQAAVRAATERRTRRNAPRRSQRLAATS